MLKNDQKNNENLAMFGYFSCVVLLIIQPELMLQIIKYLHIHTIKYVLPKIELTNFCSICLLTDIIQSPNIKFYPKVLYDFISIFLLFQCVTVLIQKQLFADILKNRFS